MPCWPGEHYQTVQAFALELLSLNHFPSSLWLAEEVQQRTFGGIEPLLFENLARWHHYPLLETAQQQTQPRRATHLGCLRDRLKQVSQG